MLRRYKKIGRAVFNAGSYSLIPVRDEDKYAIMTWRNEQMDILRQQETLTRQQQENYFKSVIGALFEQEKPAQFIFSFLENNMLIGYGGLVHINWEEKTAEISFLTETSRSRNSELFIRDWINFLTLLKQIADCFLNFRAIYTYAYDLRPNLYIALDQAGFKETERIRDHVIIHGEKKDVIIHTLFMKPLVMHFATEDDTDLYFNWANDAEVRRLSYQQDRIVHEDHVKWFRSKLTDSAFRFYLFRDSENQAVGQVRISRQNGESIIGISIDSNHRGLGYGSKMLIMACEQCFSEGFTHKITAYIKAENTASIVIFKKAGFTEQDSLLIGNVESKKLILER